MDKSVLTIAVGKYVYIDMAVALARSFKMWNDPKQIQFWIATDSKSLFPSDILKWVNFIELKKGELGEGFSPKLHLDKIAPTKKTLFIDSDCLIVKAIDFIFDRFEGKAVSVIGGYISEGEWFGDIKAVCKQFNIEKLPKFNGGIYYLEKNEVSKKIYVKARQLELLYDQIGFVRLRNRPNDEVIMSLSMALFQQSPVIEDGSIMAEPLNFASGIKINVFKGLAELYNIRGHPKYNKDWPLTVGYPAIVHFLGYYTYHENYKRETLILKLILQNNFSFKISKLIAFLYISFPLKTKNSIMTIFRPFYHYLFGNSKIKKSARI